MHLYKTFYSGLRLWSLRNATLTLEPKSRLAQRRVRRNGVVNCTQINSLISMNWKRSGYSETELKLIVPSIAVTMHEGLGNCRGTTNSASLRTDLSAAWDLVSTFNQNQFRQRKWYLAIMDPVLCANNVKLFSMPTYLGILIERPGILATKSISKLCR